MTEIVISNAPVADLFAQIRYFTSQILPTKSYRKYFNYISARSQVDSTCLTIDKIKPELCPNSLPFVECNVDCHKQIGPFIFPASQFEYDNNKFNHLSKIWTENIINFAKIESILHCMCFLSSWKYSPPPPPLLRRKYIAHARLAQNILTEL